MTTNTNQSDQSDDRSERWLSPDRHQLALAILAIATAAIGFGLFGSGLRMSGDFGENAMSTFLPVFVILALVSYALVVISTGRILMRDDNPSGWDLVVKGPFYWMSVEIMLIALTFLIRLFQSTMPG